MKLLVSLLLCLLLSASLAYGDVIIDDFDLEVETRHLRRNGRGHGGGGGSGGGWRGGVGGHHGRHGGGGHGGGHGGTTNNIDESCDSEGCNNGNNVKNNMARSHPGDLIHKLLDSSHLIERTVNQTVTGIVSHTWSEDEQVDEWIKQHVAQMQSFMENGRRIRQHDPLFVAIFDNAPLIDFNYVTSDSDDGDDGDGEEAGEENGSDSSLDVVIDKGVFVNETSTDPCSIALIQAHADAVSGFIESGRASMHQDHEVPDICL